MTIDINELRRLALDGDLAAMQEIILRLEAAEKEVESLRQGISFRDDVVAALAVERDALRAKIDAMEKRLRLILEEPENTLSNSKALREVIRQAKLALKESK